MNVASIIAEARALSYVNTTQVSDAQMLSWLNFENQEIYSEVLKLNEYYFYDSITMDTVPYQNKYTLTESTSTVSAFKKMLQVNIKYQPDNYQAWVTGTVYAKWDKVMNAWKTYIANTNHTAWATFNWDASKWVQIFENYMDTDETWFLDNMDNLNQSLVSNMPAVFSNSYIYQAWKPKYFMATSWWVNSLYIYPYPTEAIVDWIKIYWVKSAPDLTLASTEDDILLEREYHRIFVFALLPYCWHARWMINEKNDAIAEYERRKALILSEITDRNMSPTLATLPNLRNLS